jgi:hypothetical protein
MLFKSRMMGITKGKFSEVRNTLDSRQLKPEHFMPKVMLKQDECNTG